MSSYLHQHPRSLAKPSDRSAMLLSPNASCSSVKRRYRMDKMMRERVPVELIVKIFEYMVETEVVRDLHPWKLYRSHKKWLQAASTCRRWREVARNTPSLWRVIDVGSTGEALRMGLERTSQATVDVTFHYPATIPSAMETLFKMAHRIERLIVVRLDKNALRALEFLFWRAPLPVLKELFMNTVPLATDHEFFPVLKPEFVPSLHVLHITHLRFNWSTPIIQNLRSLYLGCSPGQDCCRIDDLLRFLEPCNRLEFLKIDQAFPIRGEDHAKLTIALPQLRDVYFVADDPRVVYSLLSHIRFNPSVNVDVHMHINLHGPHDPFAHTGIADVIPSDAGCIPLLQTATHVTLRDLDVECRGPKGCGRLAVKFVFDQVNHWTYTISTHAKQLGDLLCNAPVSALTVNLDSENFFAADLRCLLSKLPKITVLDHCDVRTADTELIEALTLPCQGSVPLRPAEIPPTTILPKLRTLIIYSALEQSDRFMVGLRDCLRTRSIAGVMLNDLRVVLDHSDDSEDSGGSGGECPLAAKELEFQSRESEGELTKWVRGSVDVMRLG
ncbi:hypothetical protein C8T65DRAFT_831628 [Cerioporus squamosus]|nr:hypothetical protein C8T65DRAFT_831628 [Cerioporus squamosus]